VIVVERLHVLFSPNLEPESQQIHLQFNYYRLVIPQGPVVDKYAPKLKEVLNETSKSVFGKV
jgi:hypothetical protein